MAFMHRGTKESESSGSGCLGALDAIPAMPLTLFVVVMLSTCPEASWLASLVGAQEPTSEEVPAAGYRRPYCKKRRRAPVRNPALTLQGTAVATPPPREATLTLLAVLKILFGYFRSRG